MWYFKEQDENGDFQDKEGKIYSLTECHRVMAPDGKMNAELGYTEFDSLEDCLKSWQLTEIKKK